MDEFEDLKDHRGRKLLSLVDYGFDICPFVPVKPDATAEDLQTQIDALKDLAEQSYIPFDGMVLRFDSFSYAGTICIMMNVPAHGRSAMNHINVLTGATPISARYGTGN